MSYDFFVGLRPPRLNHLDLPLWQVWNVETLLDERPLLKLELVDWLLLFDEQQSSACYERTLPILLVNFHTDVQIVFKRFALLHFCVFSLWWCDWHRVHGVVPWPITWNKPLWYRLGCSCSLLLVYGLIGSWEIFLLFKLRRLRFSWYIGVFNPGYVRFFLIWSHCYKISLVARFLVIEVHAAKDYKADLLLISLL